MFDKLDIGLKASIRNFMKKFAIDETSPEVRIFEYFVNYVVISNAIEKEYQDFSKISTGDSRGIDGIGIIVNGKVRGELQDLEGLGDDEKIRMEIIFIQSTLGASFNYQKFSAFVDASISFLANDFRIEPFSEILEKLFGEDNSGEDNSYIDNMIETPKVSLYFVSGKTSHNIEKDQMIEQQRKFTNRNDITGKYELKDIYFWQKDELKQAFEKIPKFYRVSLEIEESVQLPPKSNIEISLLCAIKFNELKKLILNSEGYIREDLFVENPRFYLRETSVNADMRKTLENKNLREYFVYLNNGLTVICDSIERHPTRRNTYILTHPRIINGCQTTHILYEKYKEDPDALENVEVVAKIMATKDKNLKEKIIFSANNQNAIDKDLQALNEFHKEIEKYYIAQEEIALNDQKKVKLHYERLRGQYPEVEPYYAKIDIENMAKVYISVLLKEPDKMKSNAIKRIKKYIEEKKIFYMEDDPPKYYYCGLLYFWLNNFIVNDEIQLKTRTMDMHLLLSVDLFLEKEGFRTIDEKINFLNTKNNAFSIFSKANAHVTTQGYLFERRGFYSHPKTDKLIMSIKNL